MDCPESFDTIYDYSAISLILEEGQKDKDFDAYFRLDSKRPTGVYPVEVGEKIIEGVQGIETGPSLYSFK